MTTMTADKDEIVRRRLALGLTTNGLAKRAGIDHRALARIESGETERPHPMTLQKIERVLHDLEHELGVSSQPKTPSSEGGLIEFTVESDFGVKVFVKGPVQDAAALEESVVRLIRRIRDEGDAPKGG